MLSIISRNPHKLGRNPKYCFLSLPPSLSLSLPPSLSPSLPPSLSVCLHLLAYSPSNQDISSQQVSLIRDQIRRDIPGCQVTQCLRLASSHVDRALPCVTSRCQAIAQSFSLAPWLPWKPILSLSLLMLVWCLYYELPFWRLWEPQKENRRLESFLPIIFDLCPHQSIKIFLH